MFETWHKMLAMLESDLDARKVITHRLPVAEFRTGFEIMRTGNCEDRAGLEGVNAAPLTAA